VPLVSALVKIGDPYSPLTASQVARKSGERPPSLQRQRHKKETNRRAQKLIRWRLPDRKPSSDIVDCCAWYAEREATDNNGEQNGRFHAVDFLLVEVEFVGKADHG
jgi:hypothetical protein